MDSLDLDGIRDELVRMSFPYKRELVDLWKADAVRMGGDALASYIVDHDALFR